MANDVVLWVIVYFCVTSVNTKDTRLYSGVGDVTDFDNPQLDLNAIYDCASSNNMFSNSKKFHYVCFPCPAIIRLTFTFLIFINDAQTLLSEFSEHLQ